jgi:hypothetical protein
VQQTPNANVCRMIQEMAASSSPCRPANVGRDKKQVKRQALRRARRHSPRAHDKSGMQNYGDPIVKNKK